MVRSAGSPSIADHLYVVQRPGGLRTNDRFSGAIFGGSLNVPHAIAVDSRGNIYVGENFDGRRFQHFLFRGVGTPKAGMIPPPLP